MPSHAAVSLPRLGFFFFSHKTLLVIRYFPLSNEKSYFHLPSVRLLRSSCRFCVVGASELALSHRLTFRLWSSRLFHVSFPLPFFFFFFSPPRSSLEATLPSVTSPPRHPCSYLGHSCHCFAWYCSIRSCVLRWMLTPVLGLPCSVGSRDRWLRVPPLCFWNAGLICLPRLQPLNPFRLKPGRRGNSSSQW